MAEETIIYPLPLISVIVPIFACFVIFLLLPPLVWHIRNSNVGAAALTFWLIVLNLINFLNGLVWPRTNIPTWWHGAIYCDIQLRLIVGGIIGGLPGGTLCISKALAKVLDTNRQVVVRDKKDRRRQNVLDGLLSFGLPIYFMVVYYVVHNGRYYIVSTYGCDTPMDRSWVTIVLLMMWPPILLLASSYYAVLVIYRLYTYRTQVSSLLHQNKTTRSRFLRLFIMSNLILLLLLPLSIYQLIDFMVPSATQGTLHPYSWAAVHDDWNFVVELPSSMGRKYFDRWIWIICGGIVFGCFGTGRDARATYRHWAKRMGLDKVFPFLARSGISEEGMHKLSWLGSIASIPKALFSKMGSSTADSPVKDSFANNSTNHNLAMKDSLCLSKRSTADTISHLPVFEPSHITKPSPASQPGMQSHSKWSLFASMPNIGQAFAGASSIPQSSMERNVPERISVSLSSPMIGNLSPSGSTVQGTTARKGEEERGLHMV